MYLMMPLMAVVFTPLAIWRREWAFHGIHTYTLWVRWTARRMVGLRSELRGTVPRGAVLIAAKHQSFFDIILMVSVLDRPKFIMKRSLVWAPILGWYALRIGCVPVDRGKRGRAVQQMVEGVRGPTGAEPGQLIIYPQGTRVAPGVHLPYKIGGRGAVFRTRPGLRSGRHQCRRVLAAHRHLSPARPGGGRIP
jgi:1-acyl-sn-glycerol-3-phosphate acyltransferase